jgi:predicted O-methyltransferase YrrM
MVINAWSGILSEFDSLWEFIVKRRPFVVQTYNELGHVFDLIKGCESYLEVGSAEGDSLYVLAHALKPGARITSVDLGENHCKPFIDEVFQLLSPKYSVALYTGDSRDGSTYPNRKRHDVVFIDGGHDYETVWSDIRMYGALATKYLIFHDVKMPPVKQAVDEYVKQTGSKYYEFLDSEDKGMGIITL